MRATLVRGSFAGLVARIAAILSGLLSAVVLARVLEPSGYGAYSYAFAIIAIVMIPVQLGLPTLVLRETARANAEENWPLLRGIWKWSGYAVSGGSVLALCGAIAWLTFEGDDIAPVESSTLFWGLPLIPLMALSAVRASALSGLRLPVRSHLVDQVLRPVALSVFLLAMLSIGVVADPPRAMMLHSVAALLAFTVGAMLLHRAQPDYLRTEGPVQMKHRAWVSALLPLSALAAIQIVNQSADLIMLGIFRTDVEVGIYRIAVSSASLVAIGLTAMGLVLAGHIAHALAHADYARLQGILSAAALASTIISLLILTGFLFIGEAMIGLIFGESYVGAYPALIVLSLAQLVSGFFGVNANVLNMAGLERCTLTAFTVSVAVNVVLNLILIPEFGGIGAGIATLVSTTIWNILCWFYCKANFGLDSTFASAVPILFRQLLMNKNP